VFSQLADPNATPEVFLLREKIRGWRFYDYFRTDKDAPCRSPQLGTRTPVLHHDGSDLAAALQTICEIGDRDALDQSVSDAFPGSKLSVVFQPFGRFSIEFRQPGLLRPLSGGELSDGTLRYLLWIAALLTPRPPSMMVLNEPDKKRIVSNLQGRFRRSVRFLCMALARLLCFRSSYQMMENPKSSIFSAATHCVLSGARIEM
jgi:predicted ATPase